MIRIQYTHHHILFRSHNLFIGNRNIELTKTILFTDREIGRKKNRKLRICEDEGFDEIPHF